MLLRNTWLIGLLLLPLFFVAGCGGGKQVDIWNGTYVTEGDFLIDKSINDFEAELEQTDPETGLTEKAKVRLKGYSSETAEVVSMFLEFLNGQFIMTPRTTNVEVNTP